MASICLANWALDHPRRDRTLATALVSWACQSDIEEHRSGLADAGPPATRQLLILGSAERRPRHSQQLRLSAHSSLRDDIPEELMRKPQPVVQENPTHWVERRTFLTNSSMLIERPETVVLTFHSFKSGVNHHNGAEWSRWSKDSFFVISVRRNRSGVRRLNVYRWGRGKNGTSFQNRTADVSAFSWVEPALLAEAVVRLWERNVGPLDDDLRQAPISVLIPRLAFPGLANRQLAADRDGPVVPPGLGSVWRESDARVMTEKLFGKRRVRKDLIRAVASADPARVGVAHAVRRHVPVDWLVEFLTAADGGVDSRLPFAGLGPVFELLNPHARRRLLLALGARPLPRTGRGMTGETMIVSDTVRTVRELGVLYGEDRTFVTDEVRKAKSWKSLHDEAARLLRIAEHENRPIPQGHIAIALDGLAVPGPEYVIVSAKQTETLFGWGEEMSNCIGGYGNDAVTQTSYLFGVYNSGELVANMEVSPHGGIVQLFGRFNTPLSHGDDAAVRRAVARALIASRRKSAPRRRELVAAA